MAVVSECGSPFSEHRRLTGLSGARFKRQYNDGGWRAHLEDQGFTELRAVSAAGVPGQSVRWITGVYL